MKIWQIKVGNGGPGMEFAMSGKITAEATKAEFERQQALTDNDGNPYFPAGEVTVSDPDAAFAETAMSVKPRIDALNDDIEALS